MYVFYIKWTGHKIKINIVPARGGFNVQFFIQQKMSEMSAQSIFDQQRLPEEYLRGRVKIG